MMGKKKDSLKNTNFNNAIAPMETFELNRRNTSSYAYMNGDIIPLDSEEARIITEMRKQKNIAANHHRKISYIESKGLWRTFVGNPRKEVTRKTKEALIEYLDNYYKPDTLSDSTVMDVFSRRQEYRKNNLNIAVNTLDRDRQAFTRLFDEEFCNTQIKCLTKDIITSYINERSKKLHIKDRALQDAVRILNGIFDYAVHEEKFIMYNPVHDINLENYYKNCDHSVKDSDEKIFTIAEIEMIQARVREEMKGRRYDFIGYAILFSIETGVRVGEIPVLRWSDITNKGIHIHRQQRVVKVKGSTKEIYELPYTKNERKHPKGGRYFPITDKIANILAEVKTKQDELGIKSEYVFCREDGNWFDKDIYAQRLRRLCERMGYSITNNHAFRMSLNSNVFIPLGLPVTQRAYLLGHSVETNERFYSHMKTDSLVDLKDVLNSANQANDAQSHISHTRNDIKIVDFAKKKSPESLINTRNFGTSL